MAPPAEVRLRIDRGPTAGSYQVVAHGPGSDAVGRFAKPFSDVELQEFVAIGRKPRDAQGMESIESQLTRDFGAKLFTALFDGKVGELYRFALRDAQTAGQPLRVTLSLTAAPELLQIPWEYLYNEPDFLGLSTLTPIVRYLELPTPRPALRVALPLRILAVVSAPSDAKPIDVEEEKTKLQTALGPMIESGAVTIDWLLKPSLLRLSQKLRDADYHVFHYIGHGGFEQGATDGVLLFENESGLTKRVSGVRLGDILHDEVSLRLAVLNSCEGARASLDDPFSGVATNLIRREIPAVIGMQFEISDRAAILFASEFYAMLANGAPVDTAIAEARKAIYADDNYIEWATPVLFMRVQDGRLFDVEAHAPVTAPSREVLLQTAAHAGLKVDIEPSGPVPSPGGPAPEPLRSSETQAAPPASKPPRAEARTSPPGSAPVHPERRREPGVGDRPRQPGDRPPGTEPERPPRETIVRPGARSPRPRRQLGWLLLGAVALFAVLAGVLAFAFLNGNGNGDGDGGSAGSTPADTAPADTPIFVPDVFEMPEEEALAAIRDAGFTDIRTERVCSNTVPTAGLVRQVLVNTDQPDGTPSNPDHELVGVDGSLREVPPSTRLHVKVANGQPCQ